VTYNDNSTPWVTNTYDRRGRPRTVAKGTNTWKLFYNTAGQLISEAGTGGSVNGLRVTNAFDGWLRRTNVLVANGATSLATNAYTYDAAGRLDTVREGLFSAQYSYLANSPLVSQVASSATNSARRGVGPE
jgi:YD repeat-containing protein